MLAETADLREIELRATIISWSICGIILQWLDKKQPETAEELVERALPLIMATIEIK
jgi:DNA-binding LacI/PurR family transcriptional regulator